MSQNNGRSSLFGVLFMPALILGGLIVLALIVISVQSGSDAPARTGNDNTREVGSDTLARFDDEFDDLGVSVGDADAPITIREFADYQCPACASFAPVAKQIREDLVDAGEARFVFFDFPLPMHDHARQAASAARCADRQDRFWPYHDRLFETQSEWAQASDPTSLFLDMAVETGVNPDRLEQCLAQGATDDVIAQNLEAGKAIGLRATPTILVGNRLFSGGVSFERIQRAVDAQTDGAD